MSRVGGKIMKEGMLPLEILNFINSPNGCSLLIKGAAGTGKTTFALQLIEEFKKTENSIYMSTRVGDKALYRQFPWLEKADMKSKILDATTALLDMLTQPEKPESKEKSERLEVAKGFLNVIDDKDKYKVKKTNLNKLLKRMGMPEMERVYNRINMNLPERSMLIIDSVEGITRKYGIEMEEFIFTLQKDLVENSNTNVIFIFENEGATSLEYIVDGVISLHSRDVDGRRIREINLKKLRSTEIKYPCYLMTLKDSRFLSFIPLEIEHSKKTKWVGTKNEKGCYKSGINDFDNLLNGGFREGTYNVIEVGEDITNVDLLTLTRPIFLNFIFNKVGIVSVLSGGNHVEKLRMDFSEYSDVSEFDKYIRVADYFAIDSDKPYVIPLGKDNMEENVIRWQRSIKELVENNKPILQYTGFDTLEYLRGGEIAIKDLFNAIGKVKTSNDVGLGILKPGLKISQEIVNMADVYIKLVSINKIPCIYGIKPKTVIYAIMPAEEGLPYLKMVPIV